MTRDIPCLTVWQPWATLIAIGAKPFEFRGYAAPKRFLDRTIGIHAGTRPVKREEVLELLDTLTGPRAGRGTALRADVAVPLLERVLADPACLPRASIICTVVMTKSRTARSLTGAEGGDSDRAAHNLFAWPLHSIRALTPVLPTRGYQGFWLHPVEVAA